MSELTTSKTEREIQFIRKMMAADLDTFKAKNIAYGDSFGVQFKKYGVTSALVRMSDKFSRIEALLLGAKNDVTDEQIEDTLRDLATYCYMTLFELEETKHDRK